MKKPNKYIWAWYDGELVSLNRSASLADIIREVTDWHNSDTEIDGENSDTLTLINESETFIIGNNIDEVTEWINESSYGEYYGVSIEQI
jgi:hypothetical protein